MFTEQVNEAQRKATMSSASSGEPGKSPLLLVSYDFHPFVGGGGALRMVKLAKYLAALGRPLIVVTGGYESSCADPSLDDELEGVDIRVVNPRPVPLSVDDGTWRPASLRRAGHVLRSVLPFPDNRFRYLLAFYRRIRSCIREEGIRQVLITCPPHSMALLAPLVKRFHPQVRITLDFRDMWALFPLLTPDTRWFRWTQRLLERWTIRYADDIVSVTPGCVEWLKGQSADPARVHLITNGYDEGDFDFETEEPDPSRIVLGYAGSTGGLTGPRSFHTVFRAMEELVDQDPGLRSRLRLRIIGARSPMLEQSVSQLRYPELVEVAGFLPHREALKCLSGSHILLQTLFDLSNAERIYTGKIFEYIRLGKPILLASPPGDLRNLVQSENLGAAADINSPEQIRQAMKQLIDRVTQGEVGQRDSGLNRRFERRELALRYSRLLEDQWRTSSAARD